MPGAEEAVVDRIQALSLQQACCPAEIRGMPSTLAIKKEWPQSRKIAGEKVLTRSQVRRGFPGELKFIPPRVRTS